MCWEFSLIHTGGSWSRMPWTFLRWEARSPWKLTRLKKRTNRWTFWWRDFGKVKVWTETHMSHLHWSVGRRMWSTFPRCDLWSLWELSLLALRGLCHGTVSGGFQRLKQTREMYVGKVYGGVLHSLQLRSKRCIQFIVRPHPRLAFKSPNISKQLWTQSGWLVGLCALLGNVWKLKMYIQGLAPSWISRKHWWRQPPLKCQLNMICKLGLTHVYMWPTFCSSMSTHVL